jgi:acetyltransferase-like isoleucine patch superfamily enzyme
LIEDNCVIGPNAVLFYDVEIGHHTLIGDGASLREQVRVGHHCIISRYVTINYNTHIGNHTRIMDSSHITGNCQIGDNVFISVLVSSTNDNIVFSRTYEEEKIIGPQISNNVSIGASACLLPRVKIGEGAFIAAGSVVTKDVEPFVLMMGIPAKPTKNIKKHHNIPD